MCHVLLRSSGRLHILHDRVVCTNDEFDHVQVRSNPFPSPISHRLTYILRSHSMVGALNKLPVAASGMMFFGDAVTFPSVSAIFTGFVAGLVYAAAKSAQAAKAKSTSYDSYFPLVRESDFAKLD